ncbi:hypothetical protein RKD19_006256 [Streptomyces canus]
MPSTPSRKLLLGLRVPVQGGEVDLAALVHGVDQVVEVRHARVGQRRLQGGQPHAEHVLRGAGQQGQVLPGGDRALLLVDDLDESGVDGDPPGLARVGRGLVPGQSEVRGGRGQLFLDESAPGVDPRVLAGPAGEPGGPREQRRGQGVARQLRFGVQPHRRQGGAV